MLQTRVLSAHGSWGSAMVFNHEEEKSQQSFKESSEPVLILNALSKILEENEEEKNIEEINNNQNNYERLPYLQSSMFATILEDTITQLRILVECNNELRIIKTITDMPSLLVLKFGLKQPETVDELEGIDHLNLGCNEYKINKLDADRKYVTDAMTTTYVNLSVYGHFEQLKKNIRFIVDRDNSRVVLEEEETKNKVMRRELHRQLRQRRNHIKSAIYDSDATIDNLKTEVEDAGLNSECRSRYMENWQRARSEQHFQTIHDTESIHAESLEYYKQRSDHEQRVHSEVELLNNIIINETLQKVEDWMNKYDKDMEAIELKIQIKKNDYQNMLDKRINYEATIENHDKLMKEWIHFKEEREKARLYREKMTNSAITVQAWWRGLLVRRQLGPYKVSKKKDKKGDKKK